MRWLVSNDSPLVAAQDAIGADLWRCLVADHLSDHYGLDVDVREPREGESDCCDVPRKQAEMARGYADRALAGGPPEDGFGRPLV